MFGDEVDRSVAKDRPEAKPGRLVRRLARSIWKHQAWLLGLLFIAITSLQVAAALGRPLFLADLTARVGLSRYTVERILYLLPIIWAGIAFGWKGGAITATAALVCMLPRALYGSPVREDALVETGLVFVMGNLVAYSLESLQRERKRRFEMESAQETIKSSEQKYRELFENAHDAIWLQDLEGNIIAANAACEKLTGFTPLELASMKATAFLTPENLNIAREVKRKLLEGEVLEQPYEQRIVRKNGSVGMLKMATSPIRTRGEVTGFQHIARDVSEEIQMQENLHFLLQQVTRAQEEERKRIARELHDDTIQALVVHYQQLWDLAGSVAKLAPDAVSARLQGLCQQNSEIIRELRRLSQDLRPAALDRFGLMPTLNHLASDLEEQAGIATRINVIGEEKRLPAEVELGLFRIIQEALRNVRKHSGASLTEITVEFAGDRTRVTVSDNGKGFVVQKASDRLTSGKLGLAGMRERASLLGGTLTVTSEPGRGTTLTATLPQYSSP